MKSLVCNALGTEEFSEERMDALLDKAVVNKGTVTFYFKDGNTAQTEYAERKRGTKHTEEYKEHMSRIMVQRWKERNKS